MGACPTSGGMYACCGAQARPGAPVLGKIGEDPGFGEDLVYPSPPFPPQSTDPPRKLGPMRAVVRKGVLVHASLESLWLIRVSWLIGCTIAPLINH
jgi:hypothetical protein